MSSEVAVTEGEGAGWLQRVGVANGPISHTTRGPPGAPRGATPRSSQPAPRFLPNAEGAESFPWWTMWRSFSVSRIRQ